MLRETTTTYDEQAKSNGEQVFKQHVHRLGSFSREPVICIKACKMVR